ncbi:hypothetical protein MRX96_022979 [Rhipicephalus microplus]
MAMTSLALSKLCSCISRMQADQLYSLEDEKFLALPQIRGMPVPSAITCIHGYIHAIPNEKYCLCCVVDTYVRLEDKGAIGFWVLYRVSDTQDATDDALVMRYLKETECNSFFAHFMSATIERTQCSFMPLSDSTSSDHDLYFLSF